MLTSQQPVGTNVRDYSDTVVRMRTELVGDWMESLHCFDESAWIAVDVVALHCRPGSFD